MVAYDGSELDDLAERYPDLEEDELDDAERRRLEDYAHLRAFLDACEADGLELPFDGLGIQAGWSHTGQRKDRAGIARVLRVARRAGLRIVKRAPSGDSRSYDLFIPGRSDHDRLVHVYAGAEYTCERVQVGTRRVERPITKVVGTETVDEPVYEWRCGPVLAPDSDQADTDPELVADWDPIVDAADRGPSADPDGHDHRGDR